MGAAPFELLWAREIGMELTEHYAMTPVASVRGIYLVHPEARYFGEDGLKARAAEGGAQWPWTWNAHRHRPPMSDFHGSRGNLRR